jgi:ABC-type transport system substrate-binding protein
MRQVTLCLVVATIIALLAACGATPEVVEKTVVETVVVEKEVVETVVVEKEVESVETVVVEKEVEVVETVVVEKEVEVVETVVVEKEVPVEAAMPEKGGELRVGVPEMFTGFGPYEARSRVDYYVIMNVMDTLVTYGRDFVPKPHLAESWVSRDPSTWIFKLRSGVTFHDGTPFDAEAAKFSLERWLEGRYASQGAVITEINVLDSLTLEIKVSEPFPTLPAVLTQPWTEMVPPAAYEGMGAEEFAKAPVGSGPFKLAEWDTATGEVVLVANEDYWLQDESGASYPYLDSVRFLIQPDVASSALALQAGDVDLIVKVSIPLVEQLAAGPDTYVLETPTLGWVYTFLNTQAPPFDDVHKRRAFQSAVNREAILLAAEAGHGKVAYGPLAPGTWAYDPSVETEGVYGSTADPDAAIADLAASDSPDGFEFTLTYPNEEPWNTVAPAVQAQLAEIGITANLDGREIGAVLDDMFANNFEALIIDWSGRIDEDISTAAFYECGGGNNFGQYCNDEIDAILKEAGSISDLGLRRPLYHQAQGLINEEAPIIIFYFPSELKAMRSNVQGYQNLGDQRPRFYNTWLSE